MDLAASFTCAADEVWRLQRGSDADCVLFQRWVNGGERITDAGSRQGLWVFAPGGELLGRANSRSVGRVLAMLEEALERFEALPAAARRLPAQAAVEPAHRWEHGYPAGGLALERHARELDPTGLQAAPSDRWNRDTLWCSADEVRAMLPLDAAVGDSFELALLADRLARFALVDNVRGQALPFAPQEVEVARLTARVVAREGARVELELEGATCAVAGDVWLLGENLWTPNTALPHGLRCELLGRASADLEHGAFTGLDLTAVGVRRGRTQLNGRGADLGPSAVGFQLGLAPAGLRLAPTFAALYEVDWIPRPALPTWRLSPAECGLEDD